jgi:hypothetical protein
VTAEVVPLRGEGAAEAEVARAAERAHAAFTRYLDRCGLAANTVRAYRRQAPPTSLGWPSASATTRTPSPTPSAPRRP